MAVIDYTSGGSPIHDGPLFLEPKRTGQRRIKCKCGHSSTPRQLKAKGGACHHCGRTGEPAYIQGANDET